MSRRPVKDQKNQPTMHDVARQAGVSQMTVSRVMRGRGYISDTIRARVTEAADQIGYVHNRLAGAGPGYDNPLVGVILPTLQNRVFTEVMSGINDTLESLEMRPVFGVTEYLPEAEEKIAIDLLKWRPKGLILTGLEHADRFRSMIEKTGVRTVEIMDIDGEPIDACVGISHMAAGRAMAQHFLERGHLKVAYVASADGRDLRAAKRFEAFAETLTQGGGSLIEQRITQGASSMPIGQQVTSELLRKHKGLQAVYFSNDDLAGGGLLHCMASAIHVPGDVALAGFNGLNFLDAFPKRLTTTRTPRYQIGQEAAKIIASPGGPNKHGKRVDLEAELFVGDTT